MPCKTCDKPLSRGNKTGYCAQHVKSSPEYRAKLSAALLRANQLDPTIRTRRSATMKELCATPEWKERNRQSCTERRLWEKGVPARTAQSNAQQGRTFSLRHGHGKWCPVEYIEMARDLRKLNVPLEEVKRMVFEHQEKQIERFRAKHGVRALSV